MAGTELDCGGATELDLGGAAELLATGAALLAAAAAPLETEREAEPAPDHDSTEMVWKFMVPRFMPKLAQALKWFARVTVPLDRGVWRRLNCRRVSGMFPSMT